MTHLRWTYPLILAASVPSAGALQAQERGTVTGVVVDAATGAPIAGVRISGPRRAATTDQRGRFELCGIASGWADLVAERRGYYRLTPTVTLGANPLPPLRLAMTRDSTWRPDHADAPAGSHAGSGRPSRVGVVLDGRRFIQSSDGCGATAETPFVDLSTIDRSSIQNITVVKGAESGTAHGFTGVDGVIIVTTSRTSPP